MAPDEDPSVTAAIVNVVCELGWRRPNDFLPLAPRLFELLVDGGNNWMAIKLIKLVGIPKSHPVISVDTLSVCYFDASGASAGAQIAASSDRPYPDHTCHVFAVRMHQRYYSRRYSWGSR